MSEDFATLGMDVDSRGLIGGTQALLGLKRQAGDTERRFTGAAALMTRAAAGLGAALGAAFASGAIVREIAQFESGMARLGAVSNATTTEMERFRDIAQELGSTTEFTARQAGDALTFLSMAGFEATESVAALPAVLDLATASGMGLAEAADTASNIMSGFSIAAENAAEVADVLAAASTRSNTTVSQLGQAMSTVAPIASTLGISLEDTAAAIGLLSDAGIQGERAGTALRGVMASLAGPTTQAQEALASYGLTADDVDISTRSLAEVMATLSDAGISTADAMTIFGREAASGALVLAQASGDLETFGNELERANGAASDMAEGIRDNLQGDLTSLASALSGVAIALGEAGLTAVIRGAVQAMTGLVRGVTDMVNAFGTVTNAVGEFVANMFSIGDTESRVSDAMNQVEVSVDNSTIAMGDQIRQATRLEAALGQGNVVTLETARVHLESARARLADIDAMRTQAEMEARQASGVDELYRRMLAARENLRRETSELTQADIDDMERYGDAVNSIQIEMVRDAERVLAGLTEEYVSLQQALSEQEFISQEDADRAAQLAAQIELSETAIENARDGMVDYNGETVQGVQLSERLAMTLNSITLDSAIAGAQALAAELGVSLHQAMQIAGLVGAAAQASADAANPVFDPRDPRYDAEAAEYAAALERTRNAMEDLRREATLVVPGVTDVRSAIDDLTTSAGGGGGSGGAAEALDEVKDASESLGDQLRDRLSSALGNVADAFGDFVSRGFTDFKSFAKSVVDTFKSMISDMISMALRNRITIALGVSGKMSAGAALAGGLPGGGVGGMLPGGGGGGLLSSFLGGGGGGGGLLGAFTGGSGLFGLGGGTGLFGLGAGSGLATGLGSLGIGAGLASALSVAIPVVGALAAAFSFFRVKTKELDAGIRLTVDGLDTMVETFRTVEKSRFWGLSKKVSTTFDQASDEIADPIQQIVSDIGTSILDMGEALGFGRDALDDFATQISVSTRGMSEEDARKAVEDALSGLSDEMAEQVLGEAGMALANAGETATQTLQRLSSSITAVNHAFGQMDFAMREVSLTGAGSAVELVDLVGGMDAFTSATEFFYQNFFSDAERRAKTLENLTDGFAEFDLELPNSMAAFRDLVEQSVADEANDLTAALLQMAPAFNSLYNDATRANEAMNGLFRTRAEQVFAATAEGNTRPTPTTLTPEERELMQEIVRAIREGDVNQARLTNRLVQIEERREFAPPEDSA